MPKKYRIIGSAPAKYAPTDEQFRQHAKDAVAEFGLVTPERRGLGRVRAAVSFGAADPDDPAAAGRTRSHAAEKAIGGQPAPAVPPRRSRPSAAAISRRTARRDEAGDPRPDGGRVIAEKPFGTDLASAKTLNATFHSVFDESQIFRIDHFLGKESVDNILVLRFANGLFEPIWNRDHIAYVQIDVPEAISIEGRAAFYERPAPSATWS